MDLITREFQTVKYVSGSLIFLEAVKKVALFEMVEVLMPDGTKRRGQIIMASDKYSIIQVLEGTAGLDTHYTKIKLLGDVARIPVAPNMLGRIFNGIGDPIDGLPPVVPEKELSVMGLPVNPVAREMASDFIQTGISAIDCLTTLVRGQKLPIFSGAGLPANEIAAQIVRQAKVSTGEPFAIVFCAIGLTDMEASFFMRSFEENLAMERTVVFMNLADDPTIERLLTPRLALATAEYLAFEKDMHILVILTDMTNYCEALREIGSAREEIPGRRGYPGYMYTDLAMLFERAGRIKGGKGSITQIPILSMPDDDITHPVPDLSGYITEGQILLSRVMHSKGIYPPIDRLPSLSRLMGLGIGEGKTREDHRSVADQVYAFYSRGREVSRIVSIVGEEGLTDRDKRFLAFSEEFEKNFVGQGMTERSIEETLELGWRLLSMIPKSELIRVKKEFTDKYYQSGD